MLTITPKPAGVSEDANLFLLFPCHAQVSTGQLRLGPLGLHPSRMLDSAHLASAQQSPLQHLLASSVLSKELMTLALIPLIRIKSLPSHQTPQVLMKVQLYFLIPLLRHQLRLAPLGLHPDKMLLDLAHLASAPRFLCLATEVEMFPGADRFERNRKAHKEERLRD